MNERALLQVASRIKRASLELALPKNASRKLMRLCNTPPKGLRFPSAAVVRQFPTLIDTLPPRVLLLAIATRCDLLPSPTSLNGGAHGSVEVFGFEILYWHLRHNSNWLPEIVSMSHAGLASPVGSLHFAVEDGARCASVKTTICSDQATTIAYTQSRYLGPNVSPTFTYAAAACGQSVSASINYSMNIGFTTFVIPISATACFP